MDKIFNFLKGRFSVMGGPMNMIFSVFSKTYASLKKYNFGNFFKI